MKRVKLELTTWLLLILVSFSFSFTIETPESESEGETALAAREYMQANSELNGVVRTEIDEMDGGN